MACSRGTCLGLLLSLDDVPLLSPVLALDGPDFQELVVDDDLLLGVHTALLQKLAVDFEDGKEGRARGARSLYDSVEEVDLLRRERCQLRGERRERRRGALEDVADGDGGAFGRRCGR